MAIKYLNNNVNTIDYEDNDVKKVILDSDIVWCKPFTYTTGTLPTGVASLTCTRYSNDEPSASTGTIANGGTIYYGDTLYWSATAATGYNNPTVTYDGSTAEKRYTVTGNVTGVTASGVQAGSIKTYTITWKYLSAYPNTWTTTTEVYNHGDTPSRAAAATVTSGNGRKVFASWDNLSPVTASRTITAEYIEQFYATITPNYCTANRTTGWYNSGTVITWTANDNYSFGGSTVKDTTTTTITSGTTYGKSPGYVKCTISGTNCSANKTSGTILAVGTTITWTATSGTNYKYGFGSGATWSDSYATTTQNVTLGTTSYSKTASNIWYNVTITKNTGTASSNYSSGYLLNGTTVTFTATANTSTVKYSYSNSSADTHTTSYTVSSAGQSISSPTVYNWYYVQISATNSIAHKGSATGTEITSGSSAWYISGQTITWTPSTNYSFSEGTSQTNTSETISNANALSKSPSYGYVTVSKTRCTGIDTGYRAIGDTTFTANTNCAYNVEGTTTTQTKTVTAGGTISSSADYIYVTIQKGSNNTSVSPAAGSKFVAYNTLCTWTSATNYSYDSGTTKTNKTDYLTTPGKTYTYSPINYKLTSCTANYCSAKIGGPSGAAVSTSTYYASGTQIYWVADSNHSFGGSAVSDTRSGTTTITAGGTPSMTPGYTKCTITGTNCTFSPSSNSILKNGNDGKTPAATITWTGTSGTNYKYSFINTIYYDPTDIERQITATVTAAQVSYSTTASYIYYNTQFYYEYDSWLAKVDGDEIVSDPGSGQYVNEWHYLLGGSSVEFSSKGNDNNIHYSFSEDDPQDLIYTFTINSAGMQINDNMDYYNFYKCTFSGTNTNASSMTDWYQWGDEVTITANSSTTYKYSFSNSNPASPTTTKTHNVTSYGSFTYNASYQYYKITINSSSTGPTNYQSLFASSSSSATSGTTVTTGTQWILKNYYLRAQAIADPDSYDKYNFSNSSDSATKWTTSSQITSSTTWNIPTMYKWIKITNYSNPSYGHAEPENWRPWLNVWVVCSSWSSIDGWSYPVSLRGSSWLGYYAVFDSYNGSTTKTEYVKTGGSVTWTSIAKWKADVQVSSYNGQKTQYDIYTKFSESYRSQVRTQVQYTTNEGISWSNYNKFTSISGTGSGSYVYWPNYTSGNIPKWTESNLRYIRCRTTLLGSASTSDLWAQPTGTYDYFTLDPTSSDM